MDEAYRIIISPQAAEDLDAIHDFVAQDSPANADKMAERILAAIATLSSFPYRTLVEHAPPQIKHPVRSLVVRPYVVFFRVLENDGIVRVLTIRHGARRKPRRF